MLDVRKVFKGTLPDTDHHTHRYLIYSSDKETSYMISKERKSKKFVCSCPDFLYRRNGTRCKHLQQVVEIIEDWEEYARK